MAIDVRTIQMRRGLAVDFNPAKMVPGEWAVSQDDEKLYMCFTAGRVIEIGTASSIIPYVRDAEAWAIGTRDGEPVDNTDPAYNNNSKYYSEQSDISAIAAATSETNAATSETNAATSETNAAISENNSEAWAVGQRSGIDVPSTDVTYHNNSKYYSEQAGDYWELIDNSIQIAVPQISIDFETGELDIASAVFVFTINYSTGQLEWSMAQ